MNSDARGIIIVIMFGLFMLGILIGDFAGSSGSYKRGQLDYQAGKIEWTVIDGKVHHIEAKHE